MNANEENLIVTDEDFASAKDAMSEAGARDGKAAGGWIADGNTSRETLELIRKQWDDGDPTAPSAPDPFSGEWAGGLSVEDMINAETDLDASTLEPEELNDLASAYEDAYVEAWHDEAERTVNAMLE